MLFSQRRQRPCQRRRIEHPIGGLQHLGTVGFCKALAGERDDALAVLPGKISNTRTIVRLHEQPDGHHLQRRAMAFGQCRQGWCAGIAPAAERVEEILQFEVVRCVMRGYTA